MLPSQQVRKLERICQPPRGWTAVLSKGRVLRGPPPARPLCSRKSPSSLRAPEAPVSRGHRVDADGWKARLVHLLCGPLASWTQDVWASRFPTTPGDCALLYGPQRGQKGGGCLPYLPSIPDQPSPLIPPLSGSNQHLSCVPSCPFAKGCSLTGHSALCKGQRPRGPPPSAGSPHLGNVCPPPCVVIPTHGFLQGVAVSSPVPPRG